MPLDFVCPNCQAKTIVDDAYCGHRGPCFSCGKEVFVPYDPAARHRAAVSGPTPTKPRRSMLPVAIVIFAGILAAGVSAVLILAVAVPGYRSVRHTTQRSSCRANLVRIGKALQAYHEMYGSYPPAYVPDKTGKPMHSWRVLILPQLNELSAYRQYHFDLPWDAPQNIAATAVMPAVFGCPSDLANGQVGMANYMVIVGPRTAFPPNGATTRNDQWVDDISETLLVVEVANSGIGWAEPVDLDASQLRLTINPSKAGSTSLSSEHAGGIHALFGDGRVHWLSNALPLEVIAAALTRDGREPFDWSQLDVD